MKNNLIEKKINSYLNQMFDAYYQVSIFNHLPGNTDRDEILTSDYGTALKLKHQAVYLALATGAVGRPLYQEEEYAIICEMIGEFKKDANQTIGILEEAYEVLMSKLVQLN